METPRDALHTVLERSLVRLQRTPDREGQEFFTNAQLLSEVLMKYTSAILLSYVKSFDSDLAARLEFDIIRSSSLGIWDQSLPLLCNAVRKKAGQTQFHVLRKWLEERRGKADSWYVEMSEAAQRIHRAMGEQEYDLPPSAKGLFSFLVVMRNAVRGHSAFTSSFYAEVNPDVEKLVLGLCRHIPLANIPVWYFEKISDDAIAARRLIGASPRHVEKLKKGSDPVARKLAMEGARGVFLPMSEVLEYNPDTDACLLANGGWRDKTTEAEYLDYYSSDRKWLKRISCAKAPLPLPASTTAGKYTLDITSGNTAIHNLPPAPDEYIPRPTLEASLEKCLQIPAYHVVTLHGIGGTGKTCLALSVAHKLVQQDKTGFDFVLWFSARDKDLEVAGIRPTRREVGTLDQIASHFCRLMDYKAADKEMLKYFADELRSDKTSYLIILDNFETIDDPLGVQRYLTECLGVKSKILITSRVREFEADKPIEVRGMEKAEATSLIRTEARKNFCEGNLTETMIDRIISVTHGVPYPIKLTVAQFGKTGSLEKGFQQALDDVELLDTLFRAHFTCLGQEAQFIFLLLGEFGRDIPQLFLSLVMSICRV